MMKKFKKLSIFCVLLCIGFTASAQTFAFGFKGGLNTSWVYGDSSDGITPRFGVHLGVMGKLTISEKFSFQPELVYSQQGAQQNVSFDTGLFPAQVYELKARHNYINVPLLVQYKLSDHFTIDLGPQVSFLISAKQEGFGDEIDAKDSLKNLDLAAALGVSYTFSNNIQLSARYNAGFLNINDVESIEDKNYNGVLQVSIGYFLR